MLGLALGFGAYNYVFYLLLYWLPAICPRRLHIDLLHSFLYTSVPWLFATATDLAIGGWLVDFLVQRGCNAKRRPPHGPHRRHGVRAGHSGRGARAQRHAGPDLDQRFDRRACRGCAGGLVAALASSPRRPDVGKVGGIINFCGPGFGIAASILTGYLVSALHSYAGRLP